MKFAMAISLVSKRSCVFVCCSADCGTIPCVRWSLLGDDERFLCETGSKTEIERVKRALRSRRQRRGGRCACCVEQVKGGLSSSRFVAVESRWIGELLINRWVKLVVCTALHAGPLQVGMGACADPKVLFEG